MSHSIADREAIGARITDYKGFATEADIDAEIYDRELIHGIISVYSDNVTEEDINRYIMRSKRSIADLAQYPCTSDKDRYARSVRYELRQLMQAENINAGVHLVLHGLLRITDRTDEVEVNQNRVKIALDVISSITGEQWREDTYGISHGEVVLRKKNLFSNPYVGNALVESGIIVGFDPAVCTCSDFPEAMCFAAIHTY